jgi:hypothetical protein
MAPQPPTSPTTSPLPAPRLTRPSPSRLGGVDSSSTTPRPTSPADTSARGGDRASPLPSGYEDLPDYSSSPHETSPDDHAGSPSPGLPERATVAAAPPSGTVTPTGTADLPLGAPLLVAAPPAATPTLPPADHRSAHSGRRRTRGSSPSDRRPRPSRSPTPGRRTTPSPLRPRSPPPAAAASPPRRSRSRGTLLVFPRYPA